MDSEIGLATTSVVFTGIGTTASGANAFLDNAVNNRLLRSTSSAKYKRDVETLDPAYADAILSLRPVWYRSTAPADNPDWGWWGLVAEEVAQVDPRLVQWTYPDEAYETIATVEIDAVSGLQKAGSTRRLTQGARLVPDGVAYDRLPVLLLSLVKRLSARVAVLEARASPSPPATTAKEA
jgi:hypothetical protein